MLIDWYAVAISAVLLVLGVAAALVAVVMTVLSPTMIPTLPTALVVGIGLTALFALAFIFVIAGGSVLLLGGDVAAALLVAVPISAIAVVGVGLVALLFAPFILVVSVGWIPTLIFSPIIAFAFMILLSYFLVTMLLVMFIPMMLLFVAAIPLMLPVSCILILLSLVGGLGGSGGGGGGSTYLTPQYAYT